MLGYKIRCELEKINVVLAAVFGGLFLVMDFAVWCASDSPLYVLRLVEGNVAVLPLWLFGLFDLLSFALLGASLGIVLGARGSCDIDKYRGAFYFIISVVLAYLHHVLLFSYLGFFVAMLTSVLVCFFIVVAIANFIRASRAAALLAIFGGIWNVYMLIFSTFIFFFM